MSVLLPPGNYTVRLSVGSLEASQPLVVRKDPNSSGTEADIETQMAMLFDLRGDVDKAGEMVNQIEIIRSQLNNVTTLLGVGSSSRGGSTPRDGARSGADLSAIKSAADALDKRLIEIEEELVQRKLTGQGQDTVRWPPKLISKLNYLGSGLAGSDFPPTTQQREVHAAFKAQLSALRSKLDDVINKDLDAFNKLLRDRGVGNVISR
jgi:hypothetical protein